ILDIPDGNWLQQRLGHHSEPGRRLLEKPAALHLSPAQSQLVGWLAASPINDPRSEEHTSELQSRENLVCRLLLEKKKNKETKASNFIIGKPQSSINSN